MVILTYTAHLSFFESYLLRQVSRVPLRLVLADDRQLDHTLQAASNAGNRLSQANRTYLAAPIRNQRAAHAKAVLLTTDTDGYLLVGSGNLGQDGYATSGEVWNAYAFSEERPEHLPAFGTVRSILDGIANRGWLDPAARQLIYEVWSATPWIPQAATDDSPVLHNLDAPLIDSVANRVAWSVDTMTVHAPFYDPDADALSTLIQRFAPRLVKVLLTKNTSVDPKALAKVRAKAKADFTYELVAVPGDIDAYIHAKFVHLQGRKQEALLTGSPNLSRSALLSSADDGNIELGVLDVRPRGGFAGFFAGLAIAPLNDISSLDLSYDSSPDDPPAEDIPHLLWSELHHRYLTLSFDQPVVAAALSLAGPRGEPVSNLKATSDGVTVKLTLTPDDAALLAAGGPLRVTITWKGIELDPQVTWPYQLSTLKARLERASENKLLAKAGALPQTDPELYQLLEELEQTLIFDPQTAWKTVKPNEPIPTDTEGDQQSIGWEDLDWGRLRRHPKYAGYQYLHSQSAAPTDIQIILAAISSHLGGMGTDPSDLIADEDDDDLSRPSSEVDADSENFDDMDTTDEDDEQPTRTLSVSQRTRRAFGRFVKRYAAAVNDPEFQTMLGPTITINNATIFNHLLYVLVQRDAIDIHPAVDAQVALWTMLWGSDTSPGLIRTLTGEEKHAATQVLTNAHARRTTLLAITANAQYDLDSDRAASLRQSTRHLLTDEQFQLDVELVRTAATGSTTAEAIVQQLWEASKTPNRTVMTAEFLARHEIAPTAADWEANLVKRPAHGRFTAFEQSVDVLIIHDSIPDLTFAVAYTMLAELGSALLCAGMDADYWRIQFKSAHGVAFWDDQAQQGVCFLEGVAHDIDSLDVTTPAWYVNLVLLERRFVRNAA
jgi:hypothetical protein